MNTNCQKCGGKCCVGIIEVFSNDDIYYDNALVEKKPYFSERIMKMKNGRCIAQKNGKCSIYPKRPTVCRAFQVNCPTCTSFVNGQLSVK